MRKHLTKELRGSHCTTSQLNVNFKNKAKRVEHKTQKQELCVRMYCELLNEASHFHQRNL